MNRMYFLCVDIFTNLNFLVFYHRFSATNINKTIYIRSS